jgi:hypothetical protein
MLMGGYRVRSGLRDVARGAGELEQVLKQKEQEKLTAQQNIQLAQYDAERIAGFNRIKDEVSKSVNEGDGSYTDEDGNFSDTKYNERWDKYIATPAKKFLTNKKAQHGVEVASITDRERDLVVTKDHWERESARKENLIYDENVKQWGNNKYNSFGELDRVVEIQVTALNSAHEGDRINDVATKEGHEARLKEMIRKEVTSYALQNPHALESKDGGQPTLVEEGNINNLNKIANRLGYDGDAFSPAEIAEVKKRYETAKNYAEGKAKEKRDLRARTMEKDIYLGQISENPEDNKNAMELLNTDEAKELLSTSVYRTLNNGFNNTKTPDPVEALKGHAKTTETMAALRAGTLSYPEGSSAIEEAKKIIYEQVALKHLDREDAEGMIEELTGFKKSPSAKSGNATAMDLGIELIKKIRQIRSKAIEDGGQTYEGGKVIEGEDISREVAKSDASFNQMIIDFEAWEKAEPRTPNEINKYTESILAPARDKIARDIVKGKWYDKLYPKWTTLGLLRSVAGKVSDLRDKIDPELPRITTDDEYDALPSGAEFIDTENGKKYRKP